MTETPASTLGEDQPRVPEAASESLLRVEDLKMYFPVKSSGIIRRTVGHVQAVDGVSFQIGEAQSLGLVGESGCGKSTTGRLITRLYKPTAGKILFEGRDLAKLTRSRSSSRFAATSR